ncbi:hypothetical protein F6V30_12385 [Oryzomonas sagensis]|uniref:Uncharacterized protein n=1 Tax=Oryzomonas sagensis TaxID=2603857 RepID=A0ABQ6TMA3_9BACT|nr:hypothetical protein [Oryzomonas sagensis]KAB0669594.1 hypothetical protein F6V30_12385 [Oryzomonas sagensis]
MKRKIFAMAGLVAMIMSNASLTLAAAAAAGSEFVAAAGASIQYSVDGTNYKDLAKLSNNVILHCFINSTSDQYSITSKHTQSVREYGTSSQDTKMYYHELSTASTGMTGLNAADTSQMTSWTSM